MRWEPQTEKKFKTQLFFILLIVAVLVIAGSLLYIRYQKDLTTKRSLQTISAIASLKVEQLVQWNKERLSEVTFFSTSQPVLRFALPVIAGEKNREPQLRKALQHILSDNRYSDIAFLDTKGEVLFSVASRVHPIDKTNKELLNSVVTKRKIVFRDFYTCPYDKKAMVSYLAPVLDNKNRVVAGMIFMLDPYDFFYPHIKSWPVPSSTAQTYLVKKAQEAIDYLSPIAGADKAGMPFRINKEDLDDIGLAVLSGKEGYIEGIDHNGNRVMAFLQPVPGTDWLLVSKISKHELFSDYYRVVGLAFLFAVTLLFLLWGGIVWAFKRRQRRIYDELYRKSRDLHRSQEEFGATLYSIGEGVIATDEKGFVTRMNMAAELLTGWTEAEAKGKPIEHVFQTLDVASRLPGVNHVRLTLQEIETGLTNKNDKAILVAKDGRQVYVSTSVAPIKGLEGKVYGVVLVIRDQSEEQVRRRMVEARLSLFEYATRHDLKETLDFMMHTSSELFKSPQCLFLAVETRQEGLSLQSLGLPENADFESLSVWAACLETLLPAFYDNEPVHNGANQPSNIEKALIVPVLRENKPVALLGLANREDGYTQAMVEHVSYLADVMWEITNEKRKEFCLLESEDKYRNLVNQMQLGLALHELILENGVPVDYRFLEVNPGYERLTGLTREQLIGNTLLNVLPESESYWIQQYGRVVLEKEPIVFENFSVSLGKYYSVTAYPVGTMQFATIVDDVTERRQMMDALRSSEQSNRELIDNINDTVWILENDGTLIDVNKEVVRQLGYSKEEILQIGLKGIDASMSNDEVVLMIAALSRGDSHLFETIHRTKTGQLIPVEVNVGRVNYMGKQVAVCIARDITQRKRAEGFQHLLYEIASFTMGNGTLNELLALVRNELGKIMDATHFYVALYKQQTDTLEELVFLNENQPAYTWPVEGTLSGHVFKTGKSALLCGKKRPDFLHANKLKEVDNPPSCWVGVPLSDGEKTIGVLVLQRFSDEHGYDETNLQILEMVAHELSVVMQRQRMINDLIQAKDKAEESDRLKTAFLANVSHEIRTPMNGILGFVEMLNDPESDQKERAGYIDIVNKSGHRLMATIDDLIEISRIEAGLIELHPTETDLAESMEYQLSFFQTEAREKGLILELKEYLKGEDALIETDTYKLDGIMSNLLNNAIKFTPTGTITFGNSLRDGQLLFYVSDTGIGIPTDRQEAIFERFVQADLTSTRPYEGSGLGLSIVRAYLDKMGGRIWLESVPGKGSTFYFTLPYTPIVLNSVHLLVPDDIQATPLLEKTVTVLVAEDDPINFIYLETLLKREGFNVYHALNGLEAVEMAKLHADIDVILMDIKMPEMNGLEATRTIRQFNQQVPIIAQTAYAFTEDKENAMKAGCTDFLTKPTTRVQLLLALQTHVPRLRMNDTL